MRRTSPRWGVGRRTVLAALVATMGTLAFGACDLFGQYPFQVRVPIQDVGAAFSLADATWFEAEQTLFIFYELDSLEGLGENSVIELKYRTDDENRPFAPLEEYEPVHIHVPVPTNPRQLRGSYSTHVPIRPRDVEIQLRYHREGALTLEAETQFQVVSDNAAPHDSRSAVLYGVFDEENIFVQWRLRHQFPAIRNEYAQELGLRREFRVDNVSYGNGLGGDLFTFNPYGYGALNNCPQFWTDHENGLIATTKRAVFDQVPLPVESFDQAAACGDATVIDAVGDFTTTAIARKNAESRPAFSELRTPITENTPVKFMLQVCNETTSVEHIDMQMQRLFLNPTDIFCIDDWATNGFSDRLAVRLGQELDEVRLEGNDMVLTIALNRPADKPGVAEAVERALSFLVTAESVESTPRLSGVWVYDTDAYTISDPEVARLVLWCPAQLVGMVPGGDLDQIPDASLRSCPLQTPLDLPLGEQLAVSQLPILPTEEQFEEFIEEYGVGQAGFMVEHSILAPTRTPQSLNVPVGDFGVATFFNNEAITPETSDSFSYCADGDSGAVVVRVDGFDEIFPLSSLGEIHAQVGLDRYELGIFWEFPFFLRISYETSLAAAIDIPDNPLPFVAAFGISSPAEDPLGSEQWVRDSFPVENALEQCTRYCDHPTFNSDGVYNIDDPFVAYGSRCYRPLFQRLGNGGFPPDP